MLFDKIVLKLRRWILEGRIGEKQGIIAGKEVLDRDFNFCHNNSFYVVEKGRIILVR